MNEKIFNTPQLSKINCPYCWGEFLDFQQINGRIRYNNQMYDDFVVLPFENANHRPYPINKSKFVENQVTESIHCKYCGREYSLALYPFDRQHQNTQFNFWHKFQRKYECDEHPSLIEKLFPLDFNEQSSLKHVIAFKYLYLINFFMLLVSGIASQAGNQVLVISIFGILFAELLLIVVSSIFDKKLKSFYAIETLPFLFHENYIKSNSFRLFQLHFFNYKIKKNENSKAAARLSVLVGVSLLITLIWINFTNFSEQPILLTIVTLIGLGLFFWLLALILSTVAILLLNSIQYLTIIASKIPFYLDPWENEQKIKIFNELWIFSFVLFLFSSVGLEIILNFSQVNAILKDALSSRSFEPIFSSLFSNPLGLLFLVVTSIMVIIYIWFFYIFDLNIKQRKKDLKHLTKKRLLELKGNRQVSQAEIIESVTLINQMKMIDEIPLFLIKWSVIVVIVEILQICIFTATTFFIH